MHIADEIALALKREQTAEPNLPRYCRAYEYLVVLFLRDGNTELASLLLLESLGLSHQHYLLACGRIGWTPRYSLLRLLVPPGD